MTRTPSTPRSGALPPHLGGSPHAVILVELDAVRFGDVLLDTLHEPLIVGEIVLRRRAPIAEYAERRFLGSREPVEFRHVINNSNSPLRVARDIEKFGPVRGHNTRVHSHNPVRRGMYVLNDGWLTKCSCGWPAEQQVHGGKHSARRAWLEHKAQVISGDACTRHAGLALVTAAEQAHELPPIPWSYAHNGVAIARLDALGRQRGTEVAQAWADALGSAVEHDGLKDCKTVHITAPKPGTGAVAVSIDGYFALDGETTK